MSVPNQTPYIIYNANGLTTVFPFEFYVISASDIQVTLNGVELTSGYSVSGVGNVGGGDVTFLTPPATSTVVMIERVVPSYRLTDYQDNGDLLADTVNKDFDRLWMAIQRYGIHLGLALRRPLFGGPFDAEGYRIAELADPVNDQDAATKRYVQQSGQSNLNRTLRVPENSVDVLPPVEQRANKLLAFNAAGKPITVLPQSGSASDVMIELAKPTGAGLIGVQPQGNLGQMFPYVTPEQFVFAGETIKDGVNDDAIQINRALDYMESVGGGVVWLSKGNYYQKTQIIVPENCTLKGSGMFATMINAMDSMDKSFNNITTKNNLMYLFAAGTEHPDYTDYTYIEGIVVEDLGVNANHLGRDPSRSGLTTSVQACGIKFTSVKNSRISRCFVTHALLHAFDVSAMTYFNDGNPTHNIDGGSDNVLIEGCVGKNTLYDDIFTCHNSTKITFKDSYAYNDGTDSNMLWQNNQNGFEVDEGCSHILVDNCGSKFLITGFQAKGHDETMPARYVVFRKCHAIDCVWSFQIEHNIFTYGVLGRNVSLEDCVSENAYNDRYLPENPTYRPRAAWLRGYRGISLKNFQVIGGKGLIDLDASVDSVTIDGLIWSGGYTGIYQGLDTAGLINLPANQTKGRHSFKNIYITDEVSTPVIRCTDNTLTDGIEIENIHAVGTLVPAIVLTGNIPNNINGVSVSGFTYIWRDTGLSGTAQFYPIGLSFNTINGVSTIRTTIVPDGSSHPARVGSLAVNIATGKLYIAAGTAINTTGTWSLVGAQTP